MRPTPAQLRALARRDPALGVVYEQHGPYPDFPLAQQRSMSHFEYLARCIVFQQLAGKAAQTIWGRVRDRFEARKVRPEPLLALGDEELRSAGLSSNKLAAVRDLSAKALDGQLKLNGLGRLSDEDVIERLTSVRGIGVWTAQMMLIFKLGRLDVFPSGDLGVLEGLRRMDGEAERLKPGPAIARTECWAPLRSVGAWLMYRVCDEGVAP